MNQNLKFLSGSWDFLKISEFSNESNLKKKSKWGLGTPNFFWSYQILSCTPSSKEKFWKCSNFEIKLAHSVTQIRYFFSESKKKEEMKKDQNWILGSEKSFGRSKLSLVSLVSRENSESVSSSRLSWHSPWPDPDKIFSEKSQNQHMNWLWSWSSPMPTIWKVHVYLVQGVDNLGQWPPPKDFHEFSGWIQVESRVDPSYVQVEFRLCPGSV